MTNLFLFSSASLQAPGAGNIGAFVVVDHDHSISIAFDDQFRPA